MQFLDEYFSWANSLAERFSENKHIQLLVIKYKEAMLNRTDALVRRDSAIRRKTFDEWHNIAMAYGELVILILDQIYDEVVTEVKNQNG